MDSIISRANGTIDAKGALHVYNREIFLGHCEKHPKKNVELLVIERDYVIGDNLRKYWLGVVVKELQRAIFDHGDHWTLKEVDYFFRELGGLYEEVYHEKTDSYERKIMTLSPGQTKVTRAMMWHCINTAIRLAAEYLNWPIPYPHEKLEIV